MAEFKYCHQSKSNLTSDVLETLRRPETAKINFTYHSTRGRLLPLDQEAFLLVGEAIRAKVVQHQRGDVHEGAAAQYQPGTNLITFAPGELPEQRVIHEAVHAYADLQRFEARAWEGEAIAFLCEWIYVAARYASERGMSVVSAAQCIRSTRFSHPYATAALQIAMDYGLLLYDRCPMLRSQHLRPLEQAVRSSTLYRPGADAIVRGDG